MLEQVGDVQRDTLATSRQLMMAKTHLLFDFAEHCTQ